LHFHMDNELWSLIIDCSLNKRWKSPFNNFRRLKQHASRFTQIPHENIENVSKRKSVVNKGSNLHIVQTAFTVYLNYQNMTEYTIIAITALVTQ
jgi:hypothetical protein